MAEKININNVSGKCHFWSYKGMNNIKCYKVYVSGKCVATYKNPRPAGEHVRRLRADGTICDCWIVYKGGDAIRWF